MDQIHWPINLLLPIREAMSGAGPDNPSHRVKASALSADALCTGLPSLTRNGLFWEYR